jgi:hypothetical protein
MPMDGMYAARVLFGLVQSPAWTPPASLRFIHQPQKTGAGGVGVPSASASAVAVAVVVVVAAAAAAMASIIVRSSLVVG